MLSRHSSVVSSRVIDLTSDSDTDEIEALPSVPARVRKIVSRNAEGSFNQNASQLSIKQAGSQPVPKTLLDMIKEQTGSQLSTAVSSPAICIESVPKKRKRHSYAGLSSSDSEPQPQRKGPTVSGPKPMHVALRSSACDADESSYPSKPFELGKPFSKTASRSCKDFSSSEDEVPSLKPVTKTKPGPKLTKAEELRAKRLEKEPEKVAKLAKKASEKQDKGKWNAVNRLVVNKADLVKDFTLQVASAMQGTAFVQAVTSRLVEHQCCVEIVESPEEGGLVRWERRVKARYDEHEHMWCPIADFSEYRRFEAINLIYVHAKELVQQQDGIQLLQERVVRLKAALDLTPRHQLFVMIDDLEAYYRKKGKGSRAANAGAREAGITLLRKQGVERALAGMQVDQRCFIIHVEGAIDAAEWIYNMTADIGVKPHKLIERSHLPFCPVLKRVKAGNDMKDTYRRMLEQLNMMTSHRAESIVTEFPTLRVLFEAYQNQPDANIRAGLLENCIVKHKKNGQLSGVILNTALSSKVAAAFWASNSLISLS